MLQVGSLRLNAASWDGPVRSAVPSRWTREQGQDDGDAGR